MGSPVSYTHLDVYKRQALQGAAMNVYINTKTMQNREQAEAMNEKTDGMVKEYGEKADLIYERTLRAIS